MRVNNEPQAEKELAELRMRAAIPKKQQVQTAVLDLKHKVCVLAYERIVDVNRQKAVDANWRRPWDGVHSDGEHFHQYKARWSAALKSNADDVDTLPTHFAKLIIKDWDPDYEKTDEQRLLELFPYTWEGTEHMEVFTNDAYTKFEQDYINEQDDQDDDSP